MAKLVLRFFDLFAWALRGLGVDYAQFRAVLGVKLTLDGRRRFTAMQQNPGKQSRNAFQTALTVNAFMGAMIGLLLLQAAPMIGMTLLHLFILVVVSLSLIADYSSVLLDTTDNRILQPRPINSRTILAARIAHIITYITLLTLSLAAASFVTGTIRFGAGFPFVFALTLVASVCLIVGSVNVLYLVALRLTSAEKLRDIILYFQVVMTVLVIGGYQIVPRLMDIKELATWNLTRFKWIYAVPPAWFAAPVDLMIGNVDLPRLVLTGLGVIIPLAVLVGVILLAPGYKQALGRLDASPGAAEHATGQVVAARSRLSRWVARRPVERAAFDFLWTLSSRDRQFKLRTYPNVAMVLVFGVAFLMSRGEGAGTTLQSLPHTHKYLLLLYMCCAMAPTGYLQMRYSDAFEAAWIYRVLPLATPGEVLRAALKVVIVRLALPSFLLVAIVVLGIWGLNLVPDLVLSFCALLLICALQAMWMNVRLPFAEPFAVMESTGRFHRMLFYMMISGAIGALHYLLKLHTTYGVYVAIPPMAIAAWMALRAYGRVSWPKLLEELSNTTAPATPSKS